MNDKAKTKEALKRQRATTIPAPKRTIDYQVDTLQQAALAKSYYYAGTNTITVNYEKNKDNTLNESSSAKAHEQKHRDNHNAGMHNLPMNLEQYYKVCCHDEISATMTELLQLRQEYINAKTDKEREKIINSQSGNRFSYYFNAIKSKKINPLAQNSADFEKEMRFIAQQTQSMWMKQYSKVYDKAMHISMCQEFFDTHYYKELKSNPQNYEKACKIAYTIGGIDFTKYMKDIPCINSNIKQIDKMIADCQPRGDVKKSFQTAKTGKQINYTASNDTSWTDNLISYTKDIFMTKIPYYYTGEPKYPEWSPEKRVSPVQTAEIYDFTSPFLKQQQELLAQKEAEEKAKQKALLAQNKVKTDRFNTRVSESTSTAKTSQNDKKKTQTKITTKQPLSQQACR